MIIMSNFKLSTAAAINLADIQVNKHGYKLCSVSMVIRKKKVCFFEYRLILLSVYLPHHNIAQL